MMNKKNNKISNIKCSFIQVTQIQVWNEGKVEALWANFEYKSVKWLITEVI